MDPLNSLTNTTPLTADQQAALKKLHAAATQLEGVFVGMLFKEMHKTVDKDTIFGKDKMCIRDRAETADSISARLMIMPRKHPLHSVLARDSVGG